MDLTLLLNYVPNIIRYAAADDKLFVPNINIKDLIMKILN